METILFIIGLSVFCLVFLYVSLLFITSQKKILLKDSNGALLSKKTSLKTQSINACNKTRVLSPKEIEEEMIEATIATAVAIRYHFSKQNTTHLVNHHSTSIWRKKSREAISSRSCSQTQKQFS